MSIHPRVHSVLLWTRLVACLTIALVFGIRAVHSETVKEAQIDAHLGYVDQQILSINQERKDARAKRDAQVDELKTQNAELQSRIAHDEGLGGGAAGIVGVLSVLGLLRKKAE